MQSHFLDFEKPLAKLNEQIDLLQSSVSKGDSDISIDDEVSRLKDRAQDMLVSMYGNLTPWQKTQIARHPDRPHASDFVKNLITEFQPMAGDRRFAEDSAILSGMGRFNGSPVIVLGHDKGHDTDTRLKNNFGMARPEGYRKSVRLMQLAERFAMPVLTFVDTAGAWPGIGAEQRGQAEAIAKSIETCLDIRVPVITVLIGEGGSGGAVALATSDHIAMLQHSVYTVASPEAAASILWRDSTRAMEAVEAMAITAQHLSQLGIIDEIIPEPMGGAHRFPDEVMTSVNKSINAALKKYNSLEADELCQMRRKKFLAMTKVGLPS